MYKINQNSYQTKYREFVKSSLEMSCSHLGNYSEEALMRPSTSYSSKFPQLKNSIYDIL